jgi:hypothetical protein
MGVGHKGEAMHGDKLTRLRIQIDKGETIA